MLKREYQLANLDQDGQNKRCLEISLFSGDNLIMGAAIIK
jgi:hypothetical protein